MVLTWWWLTPFDLILIAALVGVGVWRSRERGGVLAAHTDRLTGLPAWKAALGQHRRRLAGLSVLLILALAAAAILAGRPGVTRSAAPERASRDIVLCLDVSGSMTTTAGQVIESFEGVVKGLSGERIGLILFDNQAVTVLPLTDDYDLVGQTLSEYGAALQATTRGPRGNNPTRGTYNPSVSGSSLIADGLASCLATFDRPQEERSRSVVFGTDNMPGGDGIYTMDEAIALAREVGARVYPLNPLQAMPTQDGLAAVAEQTGGRDYALDDSTSVASVTAEIDSTELRLTRSAPRAMTFDAPAPAGVILALGLLGYLALVWRWRR